MILKINGSGVRKYEIELTDCEIKDLTQALRDYRECGGILIYGCVEIQITDNSEIRPLTKRESAK